MNLSESPHEAALTLTVPGPRERRSASQWSFG